MDGWGGKLLISLMHSILFYHGFDSRPVHMVWDCRTLTAPLGMKCRSKDLPMMVVDVMGEDYALPLCKVRDAY